MLSQAQAQALLGIDSVDFEKLLETGVIKPWGLATTESGISAVYLEQEVISVKAIAKASLELESQTKEDQTDCIKEFLERLEFSKNIENHEEAYLSQIALWLFVLFGHFKQNDVWLEKLARLESVFVFRSVIKTNGKELLEIMIHTREIAQSFATPLEATKHWDIAILGEWSDQQTHTLARPRRLIDPDPVLLEKFSKQECQRQLQQLFYKL